MDLDTGSSLFWLQSELGPEDDGVLGQSSYQPSVSIAAIDLDKEDKAKYGDGDLVEVYLWEDQVTVGKMVVTKAVVGAAPTRGVKAEFQMSKANGILGLGFPTDPANAGRKNLVQIMYDRGLVKHPSFALIGPRVDPKLAEKIDNSVIMQPRGTFVIGSVDPSYYTGSIAWCPQIVATNRWVVKLDKILINGQVAFENQLALIDTGTAYMVASPSNFDKAQKFIDGAAPLKSKGGNMFAFPADNLKKVGFVFGGREIRLHPQDFGLGGVKSQSNQMVSSIVKLSEWDFPEELWVIGGIFLDNTVTIFDYGQKRVGFADISEKDLKEAGLMETSKPSETTPGQDAPTAGAAIPASKEPTPTVPVAKPTAAQALPAPATSLAPDFSTWTVPADASAAAGRELVSHITFGDLALPTIATGIAFLDLGYEHPRAISFADGITPVSFDLHYNASSDVKTFGGTNPNSDTKLKGGAASWLRAAPNSDTDIQIGRRTFGQPYGGGWGEKGLPLQNSVKVDFATAFQGDKPPNVVVWISALDFSKAYNWRLAASATDVTNNGFTLRADTWGDSILYKADVTYIAISSSLPGARTGTFSTADVRGKDSKWVNSNQGVKKLEQRFQKKPRIVAGLNAFEVGCGRGFKASMGVEANEESVSWSLNAEGDSHLYMASAGFVAWDPVSTDLSPLFPLIYTFFLAWVEADCSSFLRQRISRPSKHQRNPRSLYRYRHAGLRCCEKKDPRSYFRIAT